MLVAGMDSRDTSKLRVWDVPVRIFHWALVLLFAFQVYSGNTGGNVMLWHMYAGYAILSLVLFRLAWGFAGSTHARFAEFLAGPLGAVRFARKLFSREPAVYAGHNPLGGWMVVALLLSLALQAGTGLFANDDIATEGPLAALVSKAVSDRLTTIHRWNAVVLIVLVGLHIAAVLFHWVVKKENLVGAMFTGIKDVPAEVARRTAVARLASNWRALALFAAACAIVYMVIKRPF